MKTLFSDPVHWTASAVGTKARFTLVFDLLAGLTGLAVLKASDSGVQAVLDLVLFIAWTQFMLLYAMRAMYLRLGWCQAGSGLTGGLTRPVTDSRRSQLSNVRR